MPRLLLVAQETGGVGKSTVTRGLAEAVPDAAILEIEAVPRLTEFATARGSNEPGRVQHFAMRATREAIEASGGKAARAEFDRVINAIYTATIPSLIDIGANTAASLVGILKEEAPTLKQDGIELGLVVVVAAEAAALADAGKLLQGSREWAGARFVVANGVRGAVDPVILKQVVGDATVTHLRGFEFEDVTREILTAGQLPDPARSHRVPARGDGGGRAGGSVVGRGRRRQPRYGRDAQGRRPAWQQRLRMSAPAVRVRPAPRARLR
jgi:hypothetical protein